MKAATMSAAGIPKPEEPGDMDVAGLFFFCSGTDRDART
jgi:hypothetical protein